MELSRCCVRPITGSRFGFVTRANHAFLPPPPSQVGKIKTLPLSSADHCKPCLGAKHIQSTSTTSPKCKKNVWRFPKENDFPHSLPFVLYHLLPSNSKLKHGHAAVRLLISINKEEVIRASQGSYGKLLLETHGVDSHYDFGMCA